MFRKYRDRSSFAPKMSSPGYSALTARMSCKMSSSPGSDNFQLEPRYRCFRIQLLIPPVPLEQSVMTLLNSEPGLSTVDSSALKVGNGKLPGVKGPNKHPKDSSLSM